MNRLLILFFVCVVDVLGFGIMIPLLPYMGDRFGASPAVITWLLMAYAACQFVATPFWGRLSDRLGRRPILLTSLAGACISYLILGFAQSLLWLLASRVLGGFMAGNISAALAYASDISKPADRAKSLGMIGAAIGIGFMLGPAVGGFLAGNDVHSANFIRPAVVSAGLSVVAMLLVAFVLPESLSPEQRARLDPAHRRSSPLVLLRQLPGLRRITSASLMMTSAHGMLESIAALWALKRFGFGPQTVGIMLFCLAFIAVLFQGGLIRVLVPRFGERRLAMFGVGAYICGLLCVGFSPGFAFAILGLVICGCGIGMWQPSASALASRQSDAANRGAVMGTFQATSSLARIIGPGISGPIFGAFGPSAPFLVAVVIAFPALVLLARARGDSAIAAPP
ncbi:MAG: MFS transporter [Steroidobacteraceae bacterium]